MAFQSANTSMMDDNTNASGTFDQILSNLPDRRPSVAYHGSEGQIDDRSVSSLDFARHDVENITVPEPTKGGARPALGSQFLSTLSNNAQPAAAALSRKSSVLHSRAKSSLSGFRLPKFNGNGQTGDKTPEKQQQSNRGLGDLFHGESAPVRLGAPLSPTREDAPFVMEYRPAFTERPAASRRRSAAPPQTTPNTPPKTSWFSRKSNAPTPPATQTRDEFLNMDINSTLFPSGPADPMSPHAFNDLLINASNAIQRMQHAYREKAEFISSIGPEIDAQKEEVEEVETRSRHLKMQLEDMSRKAEEQNQAMREMAEQLAASKLEASEAQEAVRREQAKARDTVKIVRRDTGDSEESDKDVTPRHKRRSGASQASDSGFESDADYADSVPSGPASPMKLAASPSPVYDGSDWPQRPAPSKQNSWFGAQSVGGRAGDVASRQTIEGLRGENWELRKQVAEMERNLQGCLDFVGGLKV